MSTRIIQSALAFWLVWTVASQGQTSPTQTLSPTGPDADPVATTGRILSEIDSRSELMANLEYLCDRIGPRLTGSETLKEAGEWARGRFAAYGLNNIHRETWKIGQSWVRGRATGQVVEPTNQRLVLESAGWSRSTAGPTRGPVVFAEGDDPTDIAAYRGRLKGAWVLIDPYKPRIPEDRLAKLIQHGWKESPDFTDAPGYTAFRRAFDDLMIKEGAAGLLIDSGKDQGLIAVYPGGDYFQNGTVPAFTPTPLPVAVLANESYGLLCRLRKHGPVEVELDLDNSFSPGPVEVENTVAELVGVERPDEVVILGAHLDSWDLAAGATDNGTGSMAVLEAARALKAVGARPRRTIRFVLFAGEEEGRFGSKNYVRAHASELDRISAVLIHDKGTGRVESIVLQDRYDLRPTMDRVVAPFQKALSLDQLTHSVTGGSDHVTFREVGVPAFTTRQDLAEYPKTHHTQTDTFDKVYPDEINQGAKVLAAWAYNVAMLPKCLPRAPGSGKKPSFVSASPARPAEQPSAKATGHP